MSAPTHPCFVYWTFGLATHLGTRIHRWPKSHQLCSGLWKQHRLRSHPGIYSVTPEPSTCALGALTLLLFSARAARRRSPFLQKWTLFCGGGLCTLPEHRSSRFSICSLLLLGRAWRFAAIIIAPHNFSIPSIVSRNKSRSLLCFGHTFVFRALAFLGSLHWRKTCGGALLIQARTSQTTAPRSRRRKAPGYSRAKICRGKSLRSGSDGKQWLQVGWPRETLAQTTRNCCSSTASIVRLVRDCWAPSRQSGTQSPAKGVGGQIRETVDCGSRTQASSRWPECFSRPCQPHQPAVERGD